MRRTNRISAALLTGALLLIASAPAASAEAKVSPAGWFGSLGQSVASWWAALTDGQGAFFAASEASSPDGSDDQQVALDPTGTEVSTLDEEDGEVAPHLDPNG